MFERQRHIARFLNLYLVVVALLVCFVLGYFVGKQEKETDKIVAEVKQSTIQTQPSNTPTGMVTGKDSAPPSFLNKDIKFGVFWDVWQLLQSRYVNQPIADTSLFYGAVKGMVQAVGDPYTVFLDPEVYKEFTSDFKGTFEGIGAEIGIKNGLLTVISPLEGSPAEKAGLKPKDSILEIDGKDTTGISLDFAVKLIRGEKGTKVKLKIYRQGVDVPIVLEIVRQNIDVKSVSWKVRDDNIGYLKLSHFNNDTLDLTDKAIAEFKDKKVKGVILDLRFNPGGYLETAVDIASKWITNKTVVNEQFSDGRQHRYKSRGESPLKGTKTVVLVNESSASASEIVAGALKDYKLATLVGKKTFGKGSVQVLEELGDGSAIKITVAKWLTPNGVNINENGIDPDITVTVADKDFDNGIDQQLDKAVEIFNGPKTR